MRRFGRAVMAFVLVLTALVMPGVAGAQEELSEGCATLNLPIADDLYHGAEIDSVPLAADERIIITADEPTSVGTPTGMELLVDGQVVDQDGFPGTLEYIVPGDTTVDLSWRIIPAIGNATWTVSCTNEPPPPTVPTCNGLEATIYVKDGIIVGGPKNGQPYSGELIGTAGDDVMLGTGGRDAINGRAGNDTICALEGDDRLEGVDGNDTLYGGAGADRFKGGAGADRAPDFNPGEGDSQEKVEQLS